MKKVILISVLLISCSDFAGSGPTEELNDPPPSVTIKPLEIRYPGVDFSDANDLRDEYVDIKKDLSRCDGASDTIYTDPGFKQWYVISHELTEFTQPEYYFRSKYLKQVMHSNIMALEASGILAYCVGLKGYLDLIDTEYKKYSENKAEHEAELKRYEEHKKRMEKRLDDIRWAERKKNSQGVHGLASRHNNLDRGSIFDHIGSGSNVEYNSSSYNDHSYNDMSVTEFNPTLFTIKGFAVKFNLVTLAGTIVYKLATAGKGQPCENIDNAVDLKRCEDYVKRIINTSEPEIPDNVPKCEGCRE